MPLKLSAKPLRIRPPGRNDLELDGSNFGPRRTDEAEDLGARNRVASRLGQVARISLGAPALHLARIDLSFLYLDIELGHDGVFHAMAARRRGEERVWERERGVSFERAHRELVGWLRPEDVLVGHNLHRFDRPAFEERNRDSPLLRMPTLDTLELSVLAFPRRPYHRLVKDEKLVRDARPNPVSDVRVSERVLEDAVAGWVPSPLIPHADIPDHARRGWRRLYEQNGWRWESNDSLDLRSRWQGRVCANSPCLSSPRIDMTLVMLDAWLGVQDEAGSVLPRWVRETWPAIRTLARDLRATACQDESCAWCMRNLCPDHWLHEVFGFDTYRTQPALGDGTSLQRDLVARGLREQSTFGILPTGGGKSLCFQVPAEARYRLLGQLTVVISPLQSLMKDQVDSLTGRIPHARAIYSGLPSLLKPQLLEEVRTGACGLLLPVPGAASELRSRAASEEPRNRCGGVRRGPLPVSVGSRLPDRLPLCAPGDPPDHPDGPDAPGLPVHRDHSA